MPWDILARIGGLVLLELILVAGLIAIPLGLSGNFIILGAAVLVALITQFQTVTLAALIVMAAAVIVGEIIESLLGSVMARRYGASKWGMIGAFVGGIVGAIAGTPILPIIGSIIGSFAGSAAGAIVFEWINLRNMEQSLPAGWGALLGKLASSLIKVWIGLGMAVYLQFVVLPFIF